MQIRVVLAEDNALRAGLVRLVGAGAALSELGLSEERDLNRRVSAVLVHLQNRRAA